MLIGNIENASTLHRQPFFHIYWTDCQVFNNDSDDDGDGGVGSDGNGD